MAEFKVSFSIDLAPYVAGLKSMLTLTQLTGKQIEPLLNIRVKAPDFEILDKELEKLKTGLGEAAGATDALSPPLDNVDKKSSAAAQSIGFHSSSLRGMKREALQVFGAMGFLLTSFSQLSAVADGSSKQMQKLTQSMSQGLSAGFGLASVMLLLNPALGGTAVAIGAIVAIGTALLTFLDSSEDKARLAARAMEDFSSSLKGARTKDLEAQRASLIESIRALDQFVARTKEEGKMDWLGDVLAGVAMIFGVSTISFNQTLKQLSNANERRKLLKDELKLVEQQITSGQLTEAEVRKKSIDLEIEAIGGRFTKLRAQAAEEARLREEEIRNSGALETTKNEAILRSQSALKEKLRGINDDERKERDQAALELNKIDLQRNLVALDTFEKLELAQAKTEAQRLEIAEKYAEKRIDQQTAEAVLSLEIEKKRLIALGGPDAAKRVAEIDAQIKAIKQLADQQKAAAREAAGLKVVELGMTGSILAQQQKIKDLQAAIDAETNEGKRRSMQIQLEIEKRKLDKMMSLNHVFMDTMTAGFRQMWGDMIVGSRQAVDDWDAAWLAMRNTALNILGEILQAKIEEALLGAAAQNEGETEKTIVHETAVQTQIASNELLQDSNIKTGLSSGAAGTAKAAEGAAALPFPINIFAIAAAIALATALFKGIFKAFGFEQGGRIKRGQIGFFEGKGSEMVVPDRTFADIARAEMIPQMIRHQDEFNRRRVLAGVQQGVLQQSSVNNEPIVKELRALRQDVRDLELRQELVINETRDWQAVLKEHMPGYERFRKNKVV